MKGRGIVISVGLLVLLSLLAMGLGQAQEPVSAGTQATLGTSFTYQGQLEGGGGPVSGICDFQFALYDAESGGNVIGPLQTADNTSVTDGLFTVAIDFGSGAFNGNARWLEIAVRCPAGSGAFTTLTPRQALTAAPAALSLALPLYNEAGSAGPLFSIWNSGEGVAGQFGSQLGHALYVGQAGGNGLAVIAAGQDGVYVGQAGSPSTAIPNPGNNGFEVAGAEGHGLWVGRADGHGMAVDSAALNGVNVGTASWNGLAVDSAGLDGVYVNHAGSPSTAIPNVGNNGFEVAGAEGHGLWVGQADANGVEVHSAGGIGVYVASAATHGMLVNSATLNGMAVNSAGWNGVSVGTVNWNGLAVTAAGQDGVYVDQAGNPTGTMPNLGNNGFEVAGAEGHGLWVGQADAYGVAVNSAGSDGVHVYSAGGDGVNVTGSNYAGYFAGDVYISGTCTGCALAAFGLNAGSRALQPGDVVAIQGIQSSTLDGSPILWQVVPATGGATPVGVVRGRADLDIAGDGEQLREGETGQRLVPREGVAGPGEYLTIVVSGPIQVRAAAGTGGTIQPGMRLAVDGAGLVRPLKTVTVDGVMVAESMPIIGIALEAAGKDGLLWVLVDPH